MTFYSYKGGTGRSMSLANVAWVLASNGRKVLVIDWDLEAPGLHRYFHPFLRDPELSWSEGVIDFVWQFADSALDPAMQGRRGSADGEYRSEEDLSRFALGLDFDFGPGQLDLIPAGRQGASYSERVNTFNWANFYDRLGGGALMERNRRLLREAYDYVLIDSRTGVSDTSGICTVDLPDRLVACFTCNTQSIAGAAAVVDSVLEMRGDRHLTVLPVLMRVELAEQEKLSASRRFARQTFAHFLAGEDLAGAGVVGSAFRDYWSRAEILYYPYYSYEEILAPFADDPESSNTLLHDMTGLAELVTEQALTPPGMSRSVRLEYRSRYSREPLGTAGPDADPLEDPTLAALHDDVHASLTAWKRLDGSRVALLTPERLKELTFARDVVRRLQSDPSFEAYHAASVGFAEKMHARINTMRLIGSLCLASAAAAGGVLWAGLISVPQALHATAVGVGATLAALGAVLWALTFARATVRSISFLLSGDARHAITGAVRSVSEASGPRKR